MQKLKKSVFDHMLACHMTKAEVDVILELSHYQDDAGKVHGAFYKDICKSISISYETYYETLKSLAAKKLIRIEKVHYSDRDITILGNDFTYPGAMQEGYINTGHDIFYNDEFKKLKAGEKLLALQFLKIAGAGGKYYIAVENFYKKYSELLNVKKRTIQLYLGRLKNFFNISLKSKFYWITPKESCLKYNAPSDIMIFSEHLTKVAFRRNRTPYTTDVYKNLRNLIKQYTNILKDKIASKFLYSVKRSIELSNENVKNKYAWNRHISIKFVHQLMTQK